MRERKKIAFHTVGCKLNFAETATLSRLFHDDQFERVTATTKADIYVINTCSVTDTAEKKCRQAIKRFNNLSPDAYIAVVGCYAQLRPGEIAKIPGVDLILGNTEKFNIAEYINGTAPKKPSGDYMEDILSGRREFVHSFSLDDRTRSFMKIQDGCDYGCAYCTIPMARGRSRNPDIKSIIGKAEVISATGIKEIVITGCNIGDFGKSTGESLVDLLKALDTIKGLERIRLSSLEPDLLSDDLIIHAAGSDKTLPYFHIPLQSGCNRTLDMMKREYTRELFASKTDSILRYMPSACIGVDIIAGFPGESSGDFEETYNFLKEMPVSYLHVFPFSERPGTLAEKYPDRIPRHEKTERCKRLKNLSVEKKTGFYKKNIGRTSEVLFEKNSKEGLLTGFTSNYIRVEHPWQPDLSGNIRKVRLSGIAESGRMKIEIKD